ncbi:MAG TPA: POTRA domain-containing protein [Candidatus Angelobacter sp.]
MTLFRHVTCTLIILLSALGAYTQQSKPAEISYEGQKVSSVELAGQPDLNQRQLKTLIAQPVNAPYSQEKIDETIAALKKTGQFKDVQFDVLPQSTGLQVLFVLQPAMYFGIFDFGRASRVFSYNRLLQISDYQPQEPYTIEKVEEAESNLLAFFHRTGFFMATIEPKLQGDTTHGLVNVYFLIDLKRRAKIGKIALKGASEEEDHYLEKRLHSWRARLQTTSIKTGKPYTLAKLDKATAYLQKELGKQHYLAGNVSLISAIYDPNTNHADITFQVTQGPKITINTQGAHLWDRTRKQLIPIYQENSVDPDLVAEGRRNLVSYFQSKGFFDVKVTSHIEPQSTTQTAPSPAPAGVAHDGADAQAQAAPGRQQPASQVITYRIEKGKKGKVDSINFRGNQRYDSDDLKPHVAVEKGGFLSPGKFSDQLVRKSAKNLETFYQSNGYSDAKVTPGVSNQNGKLAITFQVYEGVQDTVDSLKLQGNKSLSEHDFAPKGLSLTPGRPFSTQLLDKDRDQIIAAYLKNGFLTAVFKAQSQPLKDNPHRVAVTYTIDEGPQVRANNVVMLGAQHTVPDLISKQAKVPVGQPLNQATLLASESKLYNLGIFDWASVDPLRPTTESDNAVLIKLHEAKRNNITYGAGFEVTNRGGSIPGGTVALPNLPPVGLPSNFTTSQQRFWGPRGSVEYQRLNFRGRAETLTIGGLAARLDQRAAVVWTAPSFWNSIWSSNLTLSGEHTSENPLFTQRFIQAGYLVQRFLDAKKTKTIMLRYSFRRSHLSNVLIPDLVGPEDINERLSTLAASFTRDTRDSPLDAHRGFYESVEVGINPKFLGSNTSFARSLGQVAYYRRIGGNNIVWANSFRLGLEMAYGGETIPLSQLFFSGGGSTLRGFPLFGAGPQRNVTVCNDPNHPTPSTCSQIRVPVGGAQMVILNSEVRFPIPVNLPFIGDKLGGVVFYDGGNVYRSVGFQDFFANYINTVGFGFRYPTPIGPVRVDFGHAINQVAGVTKNVQYFITLGQAF